MPEFYEPENLKLWKHPANYSGEVWPATYGAGVGQSRDSEVLERANFTAMLTAIGGESDTVTVVHEHHWAVGWVEWIAVHQDDIKALKIADDIIGKLEDYCIIDEDLFSQFEHDECGTVWSNCYSPTERAKYLRDHVSQVYPFPGESAYSMLRAAVKGDWSYAANLLPAPSDILY